MGEAGSNKIDDTLHKCMKSVQVNIHDYQEWQ